MIARSSSFKAAEANADARETGKTLNARYLVEGGVQREGDKLRVTARLIDADSGAQLQALHFDRALAESSASRTRSPRRSPAALETSLSNAATVEKPGARSANLNAYLAYLQGRALLAKYTASGYEAAEKQFERAIALDPSFASAYVGLADAQMSAAWRRGEALEAPTPRRSSQMPRLSSTRRSRSIPPWARRTSCERTGCGQTRRPRRSRPITARDSSSIPATAPASRGLPISWAPRPRR